jgi:hypothetical protein
MTWSCRTIPMTQRGVVVVAVVMVAVKMVANAVVEATRAVAVVAEAMQPTVATPVTVVVTRHRDVYTWNKVRLVKTKT